MSIWASRIRWKPLLICPQPAILYQMQAAMRELGGEAEYQASEYLAPGAVAGLAAEHQGNICFLDVGSNPERALLLTAEIAAFMPVVAMHPANDADIILRSLRQGAREFLSEFTGQALGDLLKHLAQSSAAPPSATPARIYCIVPGKPGCGATTLAVQLALEMKRCGVPKLLLVDADCLGAGIAFLLQLKSNFHLGDAVRSCSRLDREMWGRLVTPNHDIDVLPAPEDPSVRVAVDQAAATELTSFWRENYDSIVIDTDEAYGSGRELALQSDEILLVTTNELSCLHMTRRSIESLERGGAAPDKIKLLVNRYTPAAGLKSEDVAKALKLSPYAMLRNDYAALQSALLEGRQAAADSQYGRSVRQLAERLLGKEAPPKKRSGLFGILAGRRRKPY